MKSTNQHKNENDTSILADIGENYYFMKTILTNRVEIMKLEVFQNISRVASFLIFSLVFFFILMIIITLFIVAMILYLAQIVGSYVSTILLINGLLLLIIIFGYLLFKPRLTVLFENKMLKLFNERPNKND